MLIKLNDERINDDVALGAGTMGHGIAHAAIAAGYDTRMYDVSDEAVGKGRGAIEQIVKKGVELGKLSARTRTGCWRVSRRPRHASGGRAGTPDFVIEAAPERIDLKLALFAQIERTRRRRR